MTKKEEKINSLHEEFNRIQEDNKDIDINKYLAKSEDLPDLGDIEIYNYNKDIVECKDKGIEVLGNLVDFYLGDAPDVIRHPYIQNKIEQDAQIYADTMFAQRMTMKNLLTAQRQIDSGESSTRYLATVNETILQVRENIKFQQSQKTELEKFWKDMRKDSGLNEISESMEIKNEESKPIDAESKPDGFIAGGRDLNDLINKHLKK